MQLRLYQKFIQLTNHSITLLNIVIWERERERERERAIPAKYSQCPPRLLALVSQIPLSFENLSNACQLRPYFVKFSLISTLFDTYVLVLPINTQVLKRGMMFKQSISFHLIIHTFTHVSYILMTKGLQFWSEPVLILPYELEASTYTRRLVPQ